MLWVDADIVINKFDNDIIEDIQSQDYIQAFTVHQTHEGFIPNCGVWLLNNKAIDLLRDIWNQTNYINHCWWEQKANMILMNWDQKNSIQTNLSKYGKQSIELPYEWNIHRHDYRFNRNYLEHGRFLHATCWDNKSLIMKGWTNHAMG